MSARRAIWEVARRELRERSRSRALRLSVVLVLALAVGAAIAVARLGQATPADDVGLVGPRAVALAPALRFEARAAGRRVGLHRLADVAAARRAVDDGRIDVAVIDGSRLLVRRSRSAPAVRVVQDAVAAQRTFTRMRSLRLTQTQALAALAPRPLRVVALEQATSDADQAVLAVGVLVLFAALAGYGSAVATSVTEEKSSRVVELLLTTSRREAC
jgi:ABC-2 type transport system permease protein